MHVHKTLVTASHIGATGYQTTRSVISMMQDCSQLWFDNTPVVKEYLDAHGVTMVMTSRQVDFLKKIPYGTPVTIETGVYECNGFTGARNTALYNDAGELCAVSWSMGLFVNKETVKPSRLPKSLVETFPFDEKLEMEYLDKRIDLPDGEPQIYPSVTAMHADIDYNQHVNNTQYVRMAREYLPDDVDYARMRVEYKIAAKQGDTLTPHVYFTEGEAYTIALMNEQEKPFALVEFSLLS